MVSPELITLSALIAGLAVAVAGASVGWPAPRLITAGAATLFVVVLWRLAANGLSLNEDFMPAVSVGDAVCLVAGGLPPAVVAAVRPALPRKALPVIVGALVAFTANVIIL